MKQKTASKAYQTPSLREGWGGLFLLYLIIIITMATATFIGKSHGSDYAYTAVYGSWWFTSLWALLAVTAVAYILRRRVRRMSTLAMHLALLLILAGALLTHMSAWRGMVHLRSGVAVDTYSVIDDNGNIKEEKLPFTARCASTSRLTTATGLAACSP